MVIKPVETAIERIARLIGIDVYLCPCCKKGQRFRANTVWLTWRGFCLAGFRGVTRLVLICKSRDTPYGICTMLGHVLVYL